MTERIEQTSNLDLSWRNLINRQKPASEQPQQPTGKRKKRSIMNRRRLRDNEVCVHNRPSCRTMTFNQDLSERAFNAGMNYVCCHYYKDHFIVGFYKNQDSKDYSKVSYNIQGNKPTAVFSRKLFVDAFCQTFHLTEGNYYASIKDSDLFEDNPGCMMFEIEGITESQPLENGKPIVYNPKPAETKQCPKCGRTLPQTEFYPRTDGQGVQSWCKDCCRAHGRLRNGATGEYRDDPTISQATPQQLWDELKRRDYCIIDNKLKKVFVDELK